ncbi:hypothetical protein HY29_10395 [Hyphomonas beringensis]|uniref:GH16 domain-containing protein n=1 Tax=Hyphomonas beringensis TaxID=1280946 RepID=A0A062U603_9PROT|nr:glycoside hydrolase family 16 protein [Hyphomonas beringensis]KCZ55766.1 hypothetical protein HY29_10395 [Hyphomonas beringensis]
MRWPLWLCAGALSAAALVACTSDGNSSSALDEHDPRWKLVFQDEFSGHGRPDPDKWISHEYNRKPNKKGPDGWWLRENVRLTGHGQLEIRATKINNRNPDQDDDPYDYASGMVSTEGKFEPTFGRYEARMKLPQDPGWWVAFWLFSDRVHHEDGSGEDGTEIDIMEGFGWTDMISHALHWDGYGKAHQTANHKEFRPGIRSGWHVYALEWSETEYVWFLDGNEVWRSDAGGVSKTPVWIKFSGEISTRESTAHQWWSEMPVAKRMPDRFLVDWVRVYERVELPANN